jgi:hypothetical protein
MYNFLSKLHKAVINYGADWAPESGRKRTQPEWEQAHLLTAFYVPATFGKCQD